MRQILNWFRRGPLEHGLDRELSYHFDRRVADLVRSGVPDAEARRLTRLELGGAAQVREEVRDVWLGRWLRDFTYDLRYSARSFVRTPSFTITAVMSLALGIGATTAIYSLVRQVVLQSLPVKEPARLVLVDWIGEQAANGFGSWNLMSYPICRDLERQTRIFDGVLCRAATTVNVSTGSDPQPTAVELVSGSYFSVLGVGPATGRVLRNDDDVIGASPVVVLSHDFWRTQLAGATDVVGRKILVNQHPMTVVGVAAASFRGVDVGEVPSLWIPASLSSQAIPDVNDVLERRTRWMQIIARLRPDITLVQARSGLQPWFKAMLADDIRQANFPKISAERRQQFLASRLDLTPSPQGHSGLRRKLAQPLWVLLAATGVLLGLACLNVAGLFLARGSARSRELSTRLALGASRSRIGRQLFADSVLLALAGGMLGIALAPLAVRTLITFLPRGTAEFNLHAGVDWRLLGFAFLVSLAAGIVSGLAPALQAGRGSVIQTLRERGGTGSVAGVRLRKVIVTAQIAFTLVLVIGAALFVRTLRELMDKGPGFTTSRLVAFGLDPLRNGYSKQQANQLLRRIDSALGTSPAVQTSGIARFRLLTGGSWNNPMTIQTTDRTITDRDVHVNAISPSFFSTLGIRLTLGRNFDERDINRPEDSPRRTAIVNESFVRRYLKGRNPLGALICQGSGPDAKPNAEIVGVVQDFSYRGLREESEQAYFPYFEGTEVRANFYVRFKGSSDSALQTIQGLVRSADPALPISYFRPVSEELDRSLNTERMLAMLSGGFGVLALLLSLVGLYGVMSFVVTQRTREIGIRLALGASGGSSIWLLLRDAIVMIVAGIALALPCVLALGRMVESQLFGVRPNDPASIAAATVLLTSATLAAALIPAWRASRVNPTDALRLE